MEQRTEDIPTPPVQTGNPLMIRLTGSLEQVAAAAARLHLSFPGVHVDPVRPSREPGMHRAYASLAAPLQEPPHAECMHCGGHARTLLSLGGGRYVCARVCKRDPQQS